MKRYEQYEDRWGVFGRRIERLRRRFRWGFKTLRGWQRIHLVEIDWRLGDEIMALEAVRALRDAHPRDAIFVLSNYPELYAMAGFQAIVNVIPPKVDRYWPLRGEDRRVSRPLVNARRIGRTAPLPNPSLMLDASMQPKVKTLSTRGPTVAIAHETTWANKHWPENFWLALAGMLDEASMPIIELGVNTPLELGGHDLVGKTNLRDAAHILRDVDLLISVDNGLMHLALALGTPVVALFGPTDPAFLVPNHPRLHAIRNPRPCQGFWNHDERVPRAGLCKCEAKFCMSAITVDQVMDTVRRVIDERD